jgi:hypothetical protein
MSSDAATPNGQPASWSTSRQTARTGEHDLARDTSARRRRNRRFRFRTAQHRSGSRPRRPAAATDQHRPAGSGSKRKAASQVPPHHLRHRPRHVNVQADHEIEVTGLRDPGREISLHPVDTAGDIRPGNLGRRAGMSQGDRGEINRGDLPSVRGEPQRVRPMTATCIKRASWLQTRDFTDEMRVRGTTRDPARALTQRACPELLPENLGRRSVWSRFASPSMRQASSGYPGQGRVESARTRWPPTGRNARTRLIRPVGHQLSVPLVKSAGASENHSVKAAL